MSDVKQPVRCGWCPMLLPDDPDAWHQHFFIEHGIKDGGYSIRHDVQGCDWDVAELLPGA